MREWQGEERNEKIEKVKRRGKKELKCEEKEM